MEVNHVFLYQLWTVILLS